MSSGVVRDPQTLITSANDVKTLYGDLNLTNSELFAGGYTNFGYWQQANHLGYISLQERALSSENLYRQVFNALKINKQDTILEVGCGLSNGIVLANELFQPTFSIGIDFSESQLARARKMHKNYFESHQDSVHLLQMPAEELSFSRESVSKIFSVEALQHFRCYQTFLESAYRILKPGGKLVVSTFFFLKQPLADFYNCFPTFADGVDKPVLIDECAENLKCLGFKRAKIKPIGRFVWEGFDRWVAQTQYKDTWDRNWLQAYKEKVLDYFIIEAKK